MPRGLGAGAGRPHRCTDEMIEKLTQYMTVGNYMDTAAAACGISTSTVSKWLRDAMPLITEHGDNEDEWDAVALQSLTDYERQIMKFSVAMNKAAAQAEAYAVTTIRAQMPQHWQAAMTFLERRYPHKWRRRSTVDVSTGEDGGLDEQAMLEDPEAVALLHEAVELAARGELPAGDDIVDATVVDS